LQAKALDEKQLSSTRVENMAAHYVKEIRRVQSQGPYLLGGYSLGGILVYEIAQQLKKQGEQIALLMLFEPSCPSNRGSARVSSSSANDLDKMALYPAKIRGHWRNLALLRPREKLTYIATRIIGKMKDRARAVQKISKNITCKVFVAIGRPLPFGLRSFYIREVHRQAARKYVAKPYSGHVVLFTANESSYEAQLGWRQLIDGRLEIHEVPGDHNSFLQEPNVQVLANLLGDCLERKQAMVSTKQT